MRFRWVLGAALAWFVALPVPASKPATSMWKPVTGLHWQGAANRDGTFDLAKNIAMAWIDANTVEGHWLEVEGAAPAKAPGFKVWIHLFHGDGTFTSLVLPTTRCRVDVGRKLKVCRNEAWIPRGGARVRVSFYGPGGPHEVTPAAVRFDVAASRKVRAANLASYRRLLEKIRKLYFRADEVDWTLIRKRGREVLSAPPDVDPLPQALLQIKNALPYHAHMRFFASTQADGDALALPLPTCSTGPGGVGKLVLPATSSDSRTSGRYVEAAHACLSRASTRWIIDLTQDGGGDFAVQLAALAPILKPGPKLQFLNREGARYVVSLGKHAVFIQGKKSVAWKDDTRQRAAKAVFVIGSGCASACEMLAMAVKGVFPLVGQPTAGMTSANELVAINPGLSLAVTSGVAAYMDGSFPYPKAVQPDKTLTVAQTKAWLAHGGTWHAGEPEAFFREHRGDGS